jgi:hypothetical protein
MTDELRDAEQVARTRVRVMAPLPARELAVLLAEYDRMRRDIQGVTAVIGERDQLRAALVELVEASRGLAFFDQIKCNRWNAAYARARHVAGMEDDT